MNISSLQIIAGGIGTLVILLATLIRKKRLDQKDFYSFIAAFFSASTIPPSIFLVWYVLNPEEDFLKTTLKSQDQYVAMAGITLLLASLIALWKSFTTAWEKEEVITESDLTEIKSE
jgi:hypothetical protein